MEDTKLYRCWVSEWVSKNDNVKFKRSFMGRILKSIGEDELTFDKGLVILLLESENEEDVNYYREGKCHYYPIPKCIVEVIEEVKGGN